MGRIKLNISKSTMGISLILVLLSSCNYKTQNTGNNVVNKLESPRLVKAAIKLEGWNKDFYTKAYNYYWIAEGDTLGLQLNVSEAIKDSAVSIVIMHQKPIKFATVIDSLTTWIPRIKEDFAMNKLNSLYFKEPIYYPDINKLLSQEYEEKFGKKRIDQQKLSQFLLSTSLTRELNDFLKPLHSKKVSSYTVEKFHLIDRKHYQSYLPETNTADYPDFSIHGMGLYVEITN